MNTHFQPCMSTLHTGSTLVELVSCGRRLCLFHRFSKSFSAQVNLRAPCRCATVQVQNNHTELLSLQGYIARAATMSRDAHLCAGAPDFDSAPPSLTSAHIPADVF